MTWRALVVVALLAAVGVVAGVGLARSTQDRPTLVDGVVPLAGTPAVPTNPPVEVLPDPDVAPLADDVPTHRETVGQGDFGLTLPVPDGWARSHSRQGVWTWYVPSNPQNTYVLRVSLPSGFATISGALDARMAALRSATGLQDLDVIDTTADTLHASYVFEGHRRFTLERFLSLDGSQTVYAVVELIGREVDVPGMRALLEEITDEASR